YVVTNTRTTNTTFRTRVGGSNGNQSVVFGSGATGLVEDTSNTDTLSASSLINYSVSTLTGGNTLSLTFISAEISTTSTIFPWIAGSGAVQTINSHTTISTTPGTIAFNATETQVEPLVKWTYTA